MWADPYGLLWEAVAERRRSSEVVSAVRTDEESDRTQTLLERRATARGQDDAGGDGLAEVACTKHAILRGMPEVLEQFGELQPASKRSVARSKLARSQPGRALIHRGSIWKSVRLSRVRFQ